MAPSPSPDVALGAGDAARLLDSALEAIVAGLADRVPDLPLLEQLPDGLRRTVGSFVTLHVGSELNGCIGNMEGAEVLGRAVPRLAWSAAFADPRLPALRSRELDRLVIEISLLSPLAALDVRSYGALIERLRPGRDGLVVRAGGRQGLFLPSVWEQLPEPAAFVAQLFHKAGLAPGTWPPGTQAHRFGTTRYRQGPSLGPSDAEAIRAFR